MAATADYRNYMAPSHNITFGSTPMGKKNKGRKSDTVNPPSSSKKTTIPIQGGTVRSDKAKVRPSVKKGGRGR